MFTHTSRDVREHGVSGFEFDAAYTSLLKRAISTLQLVLDELDQLLVDARTLPRGLLLDTLWTGWLEAALALGCVAVVCNHALWDASSVTQAKSAGLRLLSYTVNDEWAAQRLIDLGTDGIITDRVDLFSPLL